MGEDKVHWFLPGYSGSDIHSCVLPRTDIDKVFWRNSHSPTTSGLLEHLQSEGVTHITLVGVKISTSIQILAQHLCDLGLVVYVVTEAVADDTVDRQSVLLDHLLPIYSTVLNIVDWIEECQLSSHVEDVIGRLPDPPGVKWICNVGRGGHGSLWTGHLLQNYPFFQSFPKQRWYISQGFLGQGEKEYYCPLGKKVLYFCDEPQFSNISMYLKGRETWDEKDKLVRMARQANDPDLKHPPTYFFGPNQSWIDSAPTSDESSNTVWFLKATNKNGGKAVSMFSSPQKCLQAAQSGQNYVVQKHIANPLLTVDGYKCHVKFYSLLICDADGITWTLYTYRDAFLAVADQPWNASATTDEVQITTLRHFRLQEDATEPCEKWCVRDYYGPCRKGVEKWMGTAIASRKLKGRPGTRQFEIFSADFMFTQDDLDHPYLIEFNGGPVLFDVKLKNQVLATRGLQRYQKLYQFYGDDAPVNDHAMIRDGLKLGLNLMGQSENPTEKGRWEKAQTFKGTSEA
jgi:hypothetical protein